MPSIAYAYRLNADDPKFGEEEQRAAGVMAQLLNQMSDDPDKMRRLHIALILSFADKDYAPPGRKSTAVPRELRGAIGELKSLIAELRGIISEGGIVPRQLDALSTFVDSAFSIEDVREITTVLATLPAAAEYDPDNDPFS